LIKNSVFQNTKQKAQHQKNNRLFIPAANIKTEFKELRDRENAHRDLYWFTPNPELHPVFSDTTEEFH